MGLEAATYVGDLNTSNPVAGDNTSQGDDHLRLLKTVLQGTFPNADKAFRFPDSADKTTNYSVLAADMNKFFTCDATGGAFNMTLPTLAAGDDGWACWIMKTDSGSNAVTVVGTVNGSANPTIGIQYQAMIVWWTGSAWRASNLPVLPLALSLLSITGATAETAPAVGDEISLYDLSATANRKMTLANLFKVIGALTAEASPALDDGLALFDTSAGTADFITLLNLLKVINGLTQETTIDYASDFLPMYDASEGAVNKVTPGAIASAWRHIATVAHSGSTITFDTTNSPAAFNGTFKRLKIVLSNLKVVNDDIQILLRINDGGGIKSGASDYSFGARGSVNGSAHDLGSAGDNSIRLTSSTGTLQVGNASGELFHAEIDFVSPELGNFNIFQFVSTYVAANSTIAQFNGAGHYETSVATLTAVQISTDDGSNIASGTFSIYGLAN